jgi:hypothetical protein
LFKDHSFQSSIGPGFQWNVLNYGRLINNVRLQDAKFCELVTTYRNTVIRANAEAEDGIVEFLQSQLQAKALQRSVDAATRAVKIATAQYEGGEVDFNRVALLEQNLVQQQDLLAQAQGDIAIGLVHTYRALGGGWEVDCESLQGAPIGSQIADGSAAKTEVVPPGVLPPGLKSPDGPSNQPEPGKMLLPGPAGQLPSTQPSPPPRSQPTTRYSTATISPAAFSDESADPVDKQITLRYAEIRIPIESHSALLPSDRGEVRLRR